MTTRTRRILLLIALITFLIITPGILCYSWGYAFDWENKKPVLTGGFYFKSQPAKAKIYIDNEFKKTTPNLIRRLVPREYQIKIEKTGYFPWQKNLKIEPELINEAKNILMIPLEINPQLVLTHLSDNFNLNQYLSDQLGQKEKTFYYLQKPSYIIYRVNDENYRQEQLNLSPLPKEKEYEIISSGNQVAVLNDQNELYLFNEKEQNFELIDQRTKGAQFSRDSNKLLFYSDSEISVYYLQDDSSQPQKKAGEKELITRLSQKIKQAVWYFPTNYHILFLTKDAVEIIELDSRPPINNHLITNKGEPEQIACCTKDKQIYLLYENRVESLTIEK